MAKQVIGFEATLDGAKVEKSVKSIKTELREAQNEAINLARKFGDTSDQALAAAKRVANLKDEVSDFKDRVAALDPDKKFNAFSQSLQGVAGGFAGLQGAIGLFGTESKDLEKQLLKVQSALALSEGINAVLQSRDAFKNMGIVAVDAFKAIKVAIGSTGIGLLLVALGAIYTYWDDIKGAVSGVSAEQKKLNDISKSSVKAEQDKLEALDSQDNILKLQGKSEKEILEIKMKQTDEVIKASEIQIENQIITNRAAVETARRNKEILQTLLELTLSPLALILKTTDAVGKALGKNFGLEEKVFGGLSKLVFDPEATKVEGDNVLREQQNALKKLKNQRAGYQLEIREINKTQSQKDAKDREDAVTNERNAELERLKGIQAVSVGVNQETNNLIFASNVSAAKMNADVQKWNTQMDKEQSELRQKINEQEFVAKQENAKKYSALISGFADLAGRQTGVGKALAVADATINTYLAASQVLSAKSPQFIVNPFLRFTTAALTIATGLKNVKSILSVKVPQGGAGANPPSDGGAASAPTQAPIASAVQVAQTQSIGTSSVNIANQSAVKAFVVERDITDSQDRISKIKSAATF